MISVPFAVISTFYPRSRHEDVFGFFCIIVEQWYGLDWHGIISFVYTILLFANYVTAIFEYSIQIQGIVSADVHFF